MPALVLLCINQYTVSNIVVVVVVSAAAVIIINKTSASSVPGAEFGRSLLARQKRTGNRQLLSAALRCDGTPPHRYSLPANRNYTTSPIHSCASPVSLFVQ